MDYKNWWSKCIHGLTNTSTEKRHVTVLVIRDNKQSFVPCHKLQAMGSGNWDIKSLIIHVSFNSGNFSSTVSPYAVRSHSTGCAEKMKQDNFFRAQGI